MRTRRSALLSLLLLAVAGNARAIVITVGDDEPAADYSTIQQAVDEALARTGYREVRVAAGYYPERLRLLGGDLVGTVAISGGWDTSFILRSLDPEVTVVDGDIGGTGRVLTAACTGGSLRLDGLVLTGGRTTPATSESNAGSGGGIHAIVSGSCRAVLERLRVRGNVAEGDDSSPSQGGGLVITLNHTGRLTMTGSHVESNQAVNSSGFAVSGGLTVFAVGDAVASLTDNRIVDNTARGAAASVGGLRLSISAGGTAVALDNVIAGNRVATGSGTQPTTLGVDIDAGRNSPLGTCIECGGEIEWRRNRVEGNRYSGSAPAAHFSLIAVRRSRVVLTDSLVADAPGDGMRLLGVDEARITATNLTVTRHDGQGVAGGAFDGGTVELANSIVSGNGADALPGSIASDHNLVGVDPRFVAPAASDYRLQVGSPAIDAGTLSPPGGLAPWDLDRDDRVVGTSVDQGAHELQTARESGSCAILDPLQVPSWTPACICLSDASLRELRCSFFNSDLFVNLRLPLGVTAGKPFDTRWSLQPWRGVQGPYQIKATLIVGGKQQNLPKPAGDTHLVDGKLASSALSFLAPQGEAQLRTVLRYLPLGAKGPRQVVLDVMLPSQP